MFRYTGEKRNEDGDIISREWTYEPDKESKYYNHHVKGLKVWNDLCDLLPDLPCPFQEDDYSDYPYLSSEYLNNVGKTVHNRREVVVIGNTAFFRRYNDDWNSLVMYGVKSNDRVSWEGEFGAKGVQDLYNLVLEGINSVTEEEVKEIIKNRFN